MMRQKLESDCQISLLAVSGQRLSKRPGTARHAANIIPTMEHGKKFNQFSIESFQTNEWSLNTSQWALQTDTVGHMQMPVVASDQSKNLLGFNQIRL